MKKTIAFAATLLMSLAAMAQGEQASPGLMRSHLKIYVVVAVLVIIFLGITIYLFTLDKRLKKLEGKS